ncbi:hypothetical protein [Sphingomonas sp. MMS24-J13]|uniref:hypothetical protein n=1 Tax=Sphingomonas sp. MMS24-J13 TaxID=3238686 RepID=UPI00384ADC53
MAKKTMKLPKRIGGVKLTKELRKAGGRLLETANSPVGRELIAAGLSMAAAAATAAARKEREKRAAARAGAPEAVPANDAKRAEPVKGPADPHDIGVALGTLAQDVLGRLIAGKPRG